MGGVYSPNKNARLRVTGKLAKASNLVPIVTEDCPGLSQAIKSFFELGVVQKQPVKEIDILFIRSV